MDEQEDARRPVNRQKVGIERGRVRPSRGIEVADRPQARDDALLEIVDRFIHGGTGDEAEHPDAHRLEREVGDDPRAARGRRAARLGGEADFERD